jgi:short-subunit dehydrogenase
MPTAFITGATAGIGAAFARRLAAEGHDLVVVARNETRLAELASTLHADFGVFVEVLPADLATEDGIRIAERRLARGVDMLINNAGFGHSGKFLDVPVAEEITMLKVHCEAVLRLTHAALPPMLRFEPAAGQFRGVINVASVAAFMARGTYSASKAWVVSFSESIAQDIRGSAHVMALCPGWVRTEFHERSKMTVNVPEFMWFNADDFVIRALADYRKRVRVSVPGAVYKFMVFLSRALPRNFVTRVSAKTGRSYE